ncbi:hypothetical protein [Enterococcus faecium]|uniref:hypothetical protein n=1 Tax=Enterococcus faecium TaxID=1352 RepID=UPI000939F43F|nr:hypothetical protein [Enterococcus faecium]MBK4849498.1 hypothetical protein [Enterococcus faecium]MBK4852336.1 hypothetical protein [Enterococcus faecium]MBK4870955.1 hypothetical protein [Enterococcus faecium]PHL03545.1 hypothetical protein CQR43_14210 [Enterococcus faecium]
MITIMDYPEYKKKYPKNSMSEWFAYQAPLVLENMREEYQDVKQQLNGSEQLRAEEIIQEYEQEFLK